MGNPLGTLSKAAAVLLVAWGCAPAAALASDHPVGFPTDPAPVAYAPSSVEAAVGDTVTFSGAFADHPLVWSTGDFATQSTGTTRTYAFARPGSYSFHCQLHPGTMFGSVHVPGNAFATPEFSWAPAAPKTGQAVTFTPGAFTDPDGSIARYEWDLDGDGFFESVGAAPSRTYGAAGDVHVSLRYVDDGHEASPATAHVVSVAQGPTTGGGGGGGTPAPSPSPSPTPTAPGGSGPAPGGSGGPITPPAGGGQGAGPSPAGTSAPRVRLGARALSFRAGHARAAVSSSAAGTAKATLKHGTTVLASGTATLHAGDGSVRLTLTKAGRSALRRARGHKLSATLTVVARRAGAAKATTAHRTLAVRLA